MHDIFITGTFRNDQNKKFNLTLEKKLTKKGFSCYLPQRDTAQADTSVLENRKLTFTENTNGADNAKLVLAIGVKTQTANWGFEIGYAYASQKPVIILTTKEQGIHLMTEFAAKKIIFADDINNIDDYLDELMQAINKNIQ